MINENEIKLLLAILTQVDKYGIDTFKSLSKKVSIDGVDIELFHEVAKQKRSKTPPPTLHYYDFINLQSDEKRPLILDIIEQLNNKKNLSLSKMSSILHEENIFLPKVTKKNDLYINLIVELAKLDQNTLLETKANIINSISSKISYKDSVDRSLEGWSDIIMKKK